MERARAVSRSRTTTWKPRARTSCSAARRPAPSGLVPSDLVFRRNHVARPVAWRSRELGRQEPLRAEERPPRAGRRQSVREPLGRRAAGLRDRADAARRARRRALGDGRRRHVPLQHRPQRRRGLQSARHATTAGRAARLRRVRIADNLFYGVDRAAWGGNGNFMQIGDGPVRAGRRAQHDHADQQRADGLRRVEGRAGAWRSASCSATTSPGTTPTASSARASRSAPTRIDAFFPGAVFLRNVLAGGRASRYPADNLFPELERFSQQFVNYAGQRLPPAERQRIPARRHRRRRSRRQLRRRWCGPSARARASGSASAARRLRDATVHALDTAARVT